MFDVTVEEVQSAFAAAKNPNAALKSFLKKEVKSGEPIERFAKDFRTAVATGRSGSINLFVEKNYPKNEIYFLALARYAHSDFITAVVEKIFEKYAEDFNTTYEKAESGITVTDQAKFKSIATSVVKMIEESLAGSELPNSNFLKKATLICVFEPDVLQEVLKVL